MRVGGSSRRGVGQSTGCGAVGIEDQLFDCNDLFAIAELFQLTEKRLDLINEGFTLSVLQLAKDFLCAGLVLRSTGVINLNLRIT